VALYSFVCIKICRGTFFDSREVVLGVDILLFWAICIGELFYIDRVVVLLFFISKRTIWGGGLSSQIRWCHFVFNRRKQFGDKNFRNYASSKHKKLKKSATFQKWKYFFSKQKTNTGYPIQNEIVNCKASEQRRDQGGSKKCFNFFHQYVGKNKDGIIFFFFETNIRSHCPNDPRSYVALRKKNKKFN